MPINTTVTGTPGWFLARLAKKLTDQQRRAHLDLLYRYVDGDAPLPEGADNVRAAYAAFQRKARSNFAELIVAAVLDGMRIMGYRTAAGGDDNGDQQAARVARESGLDIELPDAIENMLTVGDGYMIVGLDENNRPVATSEDPRQIVTEQDPVRRHVIVASAKMFHDDVAEKDYCYLYLRQKNGSAVVYVASRRRKVTTGSLSFSPTAFDWDEEFGGEAGRPVPQMPVVRFHNKRGRGEYETHLDLLDRINHDILQRLTITAMQAFRQRAIKGELPERDKAGNLIDYDAAFEAGPAAIWQLPEGVDIWESAPADLTPVVSAAKVDIEQLAAITQTPMYSMFSDSVNQSAQGARVADKGRKSKVVDRRARAAAAIAQVMSLAFLFMGDTQRADPLAITPMWEPLDDESISERGSAWAQMADMPFETRLREVMQFTPDQVARAKSERMDDALASLITTAKAATQPAPVTASSA